MSLLMMIAKAVGTSSLGGGPVQLSTPALTATVVSDTEIYLGWTNVSNESSYKLEWSPNGSTSWTQIGGTIAANTTSYNHTGLTASTHYYYRITAVGDGITYLDSNYGTDDDVTLSTFVPIAGVEGVVRSLGTNTYTAFPNTVQFSDGQIGMILKESADHASAGALLFGKSAGGLSYGFAQISVGGTPVSSANNIMGLGSSNRVIVGYQSSDAGPIKFAYSDNRGVSWTAATSPFTYPTPNYSSAPYGKIIRLGGGGLLAFYYCYPLSTNPSIVGCLKSTDNGATWVDFATICTRNHRTTESGNDALIAGTGIVSECYGVVTEMGTGDSDTKITVLIRDEEIANGCAIHYRSSDGGATWGRIAGTGSIFTAFADVAGVAYQFPFPMIEHGGTIYLIAGVRWTGNYRIAYCTVSPANLYNNTGYSAVTTMSYNANADTNAGSNDFGYPEPISRVFPAQSISEILIPFYDSTAASSGLPRDMMVYQIKLAL